MTVDKYKDIKELKEKSTDIDLSSEYKLKEYINNLTSNDLIANEDIEIFPAIDYTGKIDYLSVLTINLR